MTMLSFRRKIACWLCRSNPTSISVGSYIGKDDERSIAITLMDGHRESSARMTPEGARAVALQLEKWADWAEKGNKQARWQVLAHVLQSEIKGNSSDAPVTKGV